MYISNSFHLAEDPLLQQQIMSFHMANQRLEQELQLLKVIKTRWFGRIRELRQTQRLREQGVTNCISNNEKPVVLLALHVFFSCLFLVHFGAVLVLSTTEMT